MKKQPLLFSLLVISLCFLTIFVWSTSSQKKGRIIILYGTSCAGKSTLAESFLIESPISYEVIKKTSYVDNNRRDLIQSVTGVRPKTRYQTIEAMMKLPSPYKEQAHQITEDAVIMTMEKLKLQSDQGKHTIFDVCLKDPAILKNLEGYPVTKILVFTPLGELSLREAKRSNDSGRGLIVQQRSRLSILSGFQHLYRKAVNGEKSIGNVSYDEVIAFTKVTQRGIYYPEILRIRKAFLKHFDLKEGETVAITPKSPADLLIHTIDSPIEANVQKMILHSPSIAISKIE